MAIDRCKGPNGGEQEIAENLQEVSLRMVTKEKCKEKLAKTKNFDEHHEMCTVGQYNRKYRTVTITQIGDKKNNFEWKFKLGDIKKRKTNMEARTAAKAIRVDPF